MSDPRFGLAAHLNSKPANTPQQLVFMLELIDSKNLPTMACKIAGIPRTVIDPFILRGERVAALKCCEINVFEDRASEIKADVGLQDSADVKDLSEIDEIACWFYRGLNLAQSANIAAILKGEFKVQSTGQQLVINDPLCNVTAGGGVEGSYLQVAQRHFLELWTRLQGEEDKKEKP